MHIPNVDPAQLLAPEASGRYLRDMWNPGYGLGLYYSALHELGDAMFIPMGIGNQRGIQWYYALHALFDATSALAELDRRLDLGLRLTHMIKHPRISGIRWIEALRGSRPDMPPEPLRLTAQAPRIRGSNRYDYIHLHFTESETASVERRAARTGCSLTAYMLHATADATMQAYSENRVTRWMVPVSLRGRIPVSPLSDLQASYIGLNCSRDEPAPMLYRRCMEKLKRGHHWGLWRCARFGARLGKRIILNGMRKDLAQPRPSWFGAFSSLGDIGGTGPASLIVLLPVRWHRPLGAMLYRHCNRINLTLCRHESLADEAGKLAKLRDTLHRTLLCGASASVAGGRQAAQPHSHRFGHAAHHGDLHQCQ